MGWDVFPNGYDGHHTGSCSSRVASDLALSMARALECFVEVRCQDQSWFVQAKHHFQPQHRFARPWRCYHVQMAIVQVSFKVVEHAPLIRAPGKFELDVLLEGFQGG